VVSRRAQDLGGRGVLADLALQAAQPCPAVPEQFRVPDVDDPRAQKASTGAKRTLTLVAKVTRRQLRKRHPIII
jgi:hypothetical protein